MRHGFARLWAVPPRQPPKHKLPGGNTQHGERELLASCYQSCFALAAAHEVRSIAFPSISTGRYRFPLQEAVPIALRAIAAELARRPELVEVRVVCFEEPVYLAYLDGLDAHG